MIKTPTGWVWVGNKWKPGIPFRLLSKNWFGFTLFKIRWSPWEFFLTLFQIHSVNYDGSTGGYRDHTLAFFKVHWCNQTELRQIEWGDRAWDNMRSLTFDFLWGPYTPWEYNQKYENWMDIHYPPPY